MGVADPHKGVVAGDGDREDEDERMIGSTNAMIMERRLRQMKEAHVSLTTGHLSPFRVPLWSDRRCLDGDQLCT